MRGETIDLYAEGLYRSDSVFKGAGNRGTDVVVRPGVTPGGWSTR